MQANNPHKKYGHSLIVYCVRFHKDYNYNTIRGLVGWEAQLFGLGAFFTKLQYSVRNPQTHRNTRKHLHFVDMRRTAIPNHNAQTNEQSKKHTHTDIYINI